MLPILVLALLGAGTTSAIHAGHAHADRRPSLNFGGNPARKEHHVHHSRKSAHLHGFLPMAAVNVARSAGPDGLAIAEAFVNKLHPLQSFRLQSTTTSNDGSVVHAYFVQTSHGRDIIDALVNVNVDTLTGKVVSYGDSAFVAKTAEACSRYGTQGTKQFYFGSSRKNIKEEECIVSAAETVDASTAPIDPRMAISSFLMHANPGILSSFGDIESIMDKITVVQGLKSDDLTLQGVPGAVSERGVPAKLSYVQRDGELALTWSFEYESNENWYEAHVSAAHDAKDVAQPLMVVDWQRDAPASKPSTPATPAPQDYAYKVLRWGVNDPMEGHRILVKNPADRFASPSGWHIIPKGAGRESGRKGSTTSSYPKQGETDLYAPGWSSSLENGAEFKDTRGNNVFAQDNPSGGTIFETNLRPQGVNGTFDYHLGLGKLRDHEVDPVKYINASITELFYTCNEIHDLFYEYGFNEQSGNFQEHNFGRGGLGGDAVVAMAQDGSGMNNANFATPPDGQRPRMRMYVWSGTPMRDGDLEAGIVIHEYMHGVSTRLTGGPANSGCLGWGEAGGMGEGYGDFAATIIRMADAEVKDYTMGAWAAHRSGGIRPYPYSTNMTINPATYKTLDAPGYWGVHAIGSVYAEMMFEVVEALIAKHGWTEDLFPPTNTSSAVDSDYYAVSDKTGRKYPKHGNTYALQLLVDSFKLQPCRPSFFDNRDAVIQADHIYTGGENECLLWKAFAKRGLGPDASLRGGTPWGGGVRTNDFGIPKKCVGKH